MLLGCMQLKVLFISLKSETRFVKILLTDRVKENF